ncbi:ZmpA/ZmpB/ZmpC family metallo-endopeptidase-related protein, partial [Fusibacter bizertensis]
MVIKNKSLKIMLVWIIIVSMLSVSFADVAQVINLQSTATDQQIQLSWDTVENATQYRIEVNGDDSNKVTSPTFTADGLTPNAKYEFRIRGENETEIGSWSELISVFTKRGIVSKVNITSAVFEESIISIKWDSVENAETYSVSVNGVIVGENVELTSLQYPVEDGVSIYEIKVRGKNAESSGEWSDTLTLDLADSPLDVPILLEKRASNNQIEIQWDVVERAIQYEVEINGSQIIVVQNAGYTHTGLEPNQTYKYRVRALNDSKASDWSDTLSVTTKLLNGLESVTYKVQDNIIKLTWGTVVNATSYEVLVDGELQNVGSNTYFNHTNLESISEHTYQVRAKTTEGDSDWSDVLKVTCEAEPLGIPTNLKTESVKEGISISWDAVEKATAYVLEINGNQVVLDQIAYTFAEGVNGTEYKIKVQAKNDVTKSLWSDELVMTYVEYSGTGTVDDPYLVRSLQDLINIKNDLSGDYLLLSDIDLNGIDWEPIGTVELPFRGTFNGNGKILRNLKISQQAMTYVGLFGYIGGGSVKNLTIENADVSGDTYVGAIVGYATEENKLIENCHVKNGQVSGMSNVGGVVGRLYKGYVENSSYTGIVNGESNVGGFAGYVSSKISDSWFDGEVTGISQRVGGFIGQFSGFNGSYRVERCYATGKVTGKQSVGGFIGYGSWSSSLDDYISDSFAIVTVEGEDEVGGFFGTETSGSVSGQFVRCYSAGAISATGDNKGGFGGKFNITYSKAINCYYDVLKSGTAPRYSNHAMNKLTTGMVEQSTFTNWDFTSVWSIDSGSSYPYLKSIDKPENHFIVPDTSSALHGSGTEANPYQIKTLSDLRQVKYDVSAYYVLVNDIDMENSEWEPIGTSIIPFRGTFNGNGKILRNLKISQAAMTYVGLFGYIGGGSVKNLTIENADVSGDTYVGAIVGYATEENKLIENCHVKNGQVSGTSNVGGVVGRLYKGYVENSSYTGIVNGESNVGGFAGYVSSKISDSWFDGEVTGISQRVGGFIGQFSGFNGSYRVERCYATGKVTGKQSVGGFIGYGSWSSSLDDYISDSFAIVTVEGEDEVGGFFGTESSGSVSGQFIRCYSAGAISATGDSKGGFGGKFNIAYSKAINCYYDVLKSETAPKYSNHATNKPTTGMLQQSTFTNWDFTNVWSIDSGSSYPYLNSVDKPENQYIVPDTSSALNGSGTEANPYQIKTLSDLRQVKYDTNAYYVLANDIDMENSEWEPIGTSAIPFRGTFDGKGKTLRNLKISQQAMTYVGLFGYINGGTIKNLTVENANIEGQSNVGALAGNLNNANITNCLVEGIGSVLGTNSVGGLIGAASNSAIESSSSKIEVKGTNYVGGLVGNASGTTINRSYCLGDVEATSNYAGGFVGAFYISSGQGKINESYCNNTVTSNGWTGGLIGVLSIQNTYSSVPIMNSYSLSTLKAPIGKSFGLIGQLSQTKSSGNYIYYSYFGGDSNGVTNNGGIVQNNSYLNAYLSYFDSDKAGCIVPTGQARTTELMKQASTFSNWDKTIWHVKDGSYPYLLNLPVPGNADVSEGLALPTSFNGQESDDCIVTLTWSEVVEATGYEIDLNGSIIQVGQISTYQHLNLGYDTSYYYRIRSINESDASRWSDKIFVSTRKALPEIPQFKSTYINETSIKLSWDIIEGADYYELECDGDVVSHITDLFYIHDSLDLGTEHQYRVRAINEGGGSPWSELVKFATAVEVIPIPKDLKCVMKTEDILLTWSAVEDATQYELECDGVVINCGLENSYVHESLEVDSQHQYRVRAIKGEKMSLWSDYLNVTFVSSGGSGTELDPYLIHTKEDLKNIKNDMLAHYKLVADIDLTGEIWEPIGTDKVPFKGSLDGDGHKIINLKINRTLDFSGLFGYTQDATIKRICLENPDVTAIGTRYTGALIGISERTTVSNCSVIGTGQVTGGSIVGGLIGLQSAGIVSECHSDIVDIVSQDTAGGLIGNVINQGIIEKSYSTGNVSAINSYVGGLVGSEFGMIIRECYATGNVTGKQVVGGLIGYSYSNGNLSIENSMSYGDVTASVNCGGGLIGSAYNNNYQKIKNCYSVGSVSGPGQNGGIIASPVGVIVKNTYYDASASGYVPKNQGDVAKQTGEMQVKSTFVNWDFENIWTIEEGESYPYLRHVKRPDEASGSMGSDEMTGNGTLESPYLIETKAQLNRMRMGPEAHYKLVADIDLTDEIWEPIGTDKVPFKGSLDGDGHKIINLKITRTLDFSGLFGYTQDATIKRICLENPDVTAIGTRYTGALIGISERTTVSNCSVIGTGQVTGGSIVGGLIGLQSAGIVSECHSDIVDIVSQDTAGGLIGNVINQGIIEKSYSTGNVSAINSYVGGLVGSEFGMIIRECYATGNVTGKQVVGGLIGYSYSNGNLSIENSMSYGDVTASVNCGGGLIGSAYNNNYQKIKNCYSVGSVSGPGQNGGIIASPVGVIVKNTYYDASASGYVPKNQGDVARQTGEMQVKSTFSNWDFETIWTIDEGESYPYLRHVKRPDEVSGGLGSENMIGSGTLESPYLIETKAQLNSVRMGPEAHYKLVADIDLTGETWEPIGTSAVLFKG